LEVLKMKNFNFSQAKNSLILASVIGFISLVGCTKSPETPTATIPQTPPTETAAKTDNNAAAITIKNLQAAYNGESNAHVRYLAFAKKADEEGYKKVATLFRAAALAEQIHRDNHAAVITNMGATPTNKIETPEVKSTLENLKAAIEGESYERDTMYPEFIAQAKSVDNLEAVRTLTFAGKAEGGHAKYYTEAMNNLEQWKVANVAFYVCPQCGLTTDQMTFENCPQCGEPKDQFQKVV
jgi:rubrerythrin